MARNPGFVFEFGDQFRLGLMRRMDTKMRQIQKERLTLVPGDEIERSIRQEIG